MNVQFHLTNACNLRCKHCYQGAYNPEYLSFENFKLILNKTKAFFGDIGEDFYRIGITGGEPLCVPGIVDYIKFANSIVKTITLLTNGTLLTPKILEEFRSNNHFGAIQVSLEGPEEVNDIIRGKGSFKRIRNAIRLIKDAGCFCMVSCTIAPYNFDKVDKLYEDLISYDSPDRLWFDRCIPFKGSGVLTREQFKQFNETLYALRQRWKQEGLPVEPRAARALQWITDAESPVKYVCGAGIRHWTIMHNGDVMICRRLDFPVGNLLKEEWPDIVERALPIIESIHQLPDECKNCKLANDCNGGLKCLTYNLYGHYNKKDVNCYLN